MRVTARVDYAVRALVELASDGKVEPVKAEHLATAQQIPLKFLLEILRQLKQHKLLVSRRGPEGGYTLAKPASEIAIADVIRAVEGPARHRPGHQPRVPGYDGPTEALRTVWIAVRGVAPARPRGLTLQDVLSGKLAQARRVDRRDVRRRRTPVTAGDPHVLGPGLAPTPFTADEIRQGCRPGRFVTTDAMVDGQTTR